MKGEKEIRRKFKAKLQRKREDQAIAEEKGESGRQNCLETMAEAAATNNTMTLLHDAHTPCSAEDIMSMKLYTMFFSLSFIPLSSRFLHFFLKFLGQPRLVSESIVGMVAGNTKVLDLLDPRVLRIFRLFSDYGAMSQFLVLGLEMEPQNLLRRHPPREAMLAYAGMLSTYLVVFLSAELIGKGVQPVDMEKYLLSLAFCLANTSSTVLTRLITDLKIGKSEIGRLAIKSAIHCDLITMIVMAVFVAIQMKGHNTEQLLRQGKKVTFSHDVPRTLIVYVIVASELWFVRCVINPGIEWFNKRIPEGKPINGKLLFLFFVSLLALSSIATTFGGSSQMNSFLIGLALPRDGRLSRQLIKSINICLGEFVFPFYYAFMGVNLSFSNWKGMKSFWDLTFLVSLGMIGKVLGTLAAALYLGFGVPDAICLGLLLNVKGHYHILASVNGIEVGVMDKTGFLLNVLTVLTTIVYIPLVAVLIVKKQRSEYVKLTLTLQLMNPESRLRMMVCVQRPDHVPGMIKIIEASKGEPMSQGLVVYAMDLVELTEHAAATLTYGLGTEAVEVTDEAIVETREQIATAFDAYLEGNGDRIYLRRLLAISNYSNMHQDVCNAAQDTVTTLIIMPFHKKPKAGGTLDDGNPELRAVNKKVLRNAPCSVGILVDRGLSGATSISTSLSQTFKVGVVFIGGPDDREALCYAGRIAGCPKVLLTVIRFLVDYEIEAAAIAKRYNWYNTARQGNRSITGNYLRNSSRTIMEEHIRLDNECFADFCEGNIANENISYVEKDVVSEPQAIAALRDLQEENNFNLFIVGMAGRGSSCFWEHDGDWLECPELGPLGDDLSASDFYFGASVLVIQQHDPQRQAEEESVQDDF